MIAALFAAVAAVTGAPAIAAAAPDPGGCADAKEQAASLREVKKLRDARAQLQICAAKACPAAVRADCNRRLTSTTAAIPTLVLDVKDEDGKVLQGAQLSMDGIVVSEHLDGKAVEVDSGGHTFKLELAGHVPLTVQLTMREGEKERHQAVVMLAAEPAPPEAAPPPPPAAVPTPAPATVESAPPAGPARSTAQTVGIAGIALGTAGLIFGGVYGVVTISAWQTQQNDCSSVQSCSNHAGAVSAHSSIQSDGTIATVGIVAGGILAAGGIGLYLMGAHPSESSPGPTTTSLIVAPALSPGSGGLSMLGAF
ncbi:MAG: hypothetical protein ABSE49_35095 [Polyangiaceae bacterium]